MEMQCEIPIAAEKVSKNISFFLGESTASGNLPTTPTGYNGAKGKYFTVLWSFLDTILKGTSYNKKSRIVIEYDPEADSVTVTTFTESGEEQEHQTG